jgi:hypothetical protein
MREVKNACKILFGTILKERDNLGDLRIAGTILLKWELNRI